MILAGQSVFSRRPSHAVSILSAAVFCHTLTCWGNQPKQLDAKDDSNPTVSSESVTEKKKPWDIESAPGPSQTQQIDCNTGTWINLDVSPDGTTIVFDLLGDIYTMPLAGADGTERTDNRFPKNLTNTVAWEMQPRFSPDGTLIAMTSDRKGKSGKSGDNLWFMKLDGTSPVQVTGETFRLFCHPVWSPDGNYLVGRKHFTSRRSLGAGEMWIYHRNAIASGATAGIQLTKRPDDQKDVNEPVFSPDGQYLYYSQDTTPGSTFQYDKDSHAGIYSIKRLDLSDGTTETLIEGAGGACRPTPSPDGKTLAFVRRVGADTGLHLFDLESGSVKLIHAELERDMQEAWAVHGVYSSIAWTPDSQSIVYWASGKIKRVDVQTLEVQEIPFRVKDQREIRKPVRNTVQVAEDTFDVRMLRGVEVSPSGKQVAYQALGYIYVKDLPGGVPKRLTSQTDHFEFFPSYSRDSKSIVFTTWNDQKLGDVRIASANVEPNVEKTAEIKEDPANGAESAGKSITSKPGHYLNPIFSPDGKTIVFEKRGGGHIRTPLWSREPGVYRVGVSGGASELISKSGGQPQFGHSNDRVFVTRTASAKDSDNVSLVSIDLTGNDERVHYESDWATEFRVSPDQNWLALIEQFRVHLTPMIDTPNPVKVGPDTKAIPLVSVSEQAGDHVRFSADSATLHWSLGPDLYSCPIQAAFDQLVSPVTSVSPVTKNANAEIAGEESDEKQSIPDQVPAKQSNANKDRKPSDLTTRMAIGFEHPHDKPDGTIALIGGRIATMGEQGVIEDGVIVIQGNRIASLGKKDEVSIPDDAYKIELGGKFVMPGLIDVHAHGAQATGGITPQHNWIDYARLAFGVTTIHDPSNDTHSIFAASELTKAGLITSPRTFSTGKILYGAAGNFRAEIDSADDARFHLKRMKAVGAFTVKSYNQPRRDQRQQVLAAARELDMMVVPEGGSTFMHNMTMIVDGHTGIEHTLPVRSIYDDVRDLWRGTLVGYTPTLNVAYGGLSGERFWYAIDDLWLHPRLKSFIPPHILNPRSRRREKAPLEDYNHIRVAEIAADVINDGGLVQTGGHGQLPGLCTHWEMWSFVQGGMTPVQALQCGTINGAKYLGLDGDLGSIEAGKLADLIVLNADANPIAEIRDTEKIRYVIANGNVYNANRMNKFGDNAPRQPFYWEGNNTGVVSSASRVHAQGCGCNSQ